MILKPMKRQRRPAVRITGRNLVRALTSAVQGYLAVLNDNELRMMRTRVRQLSTTNCGWDSYALRGGFDALIESHLESRARANRRAAARKRSR